MLFQKKKKPNNGESTTDYGKKAFAYMAVFILIAVIFITGAFYFAGFLWPDPDTSVGKLEMVNETVELGAVELSNYKGAKLGSKEDFRENSIRGPQYVGETIHFIHAQIGNGKRPTCDLVYGQISSARLPSQFPGLFGDLQKPFFIGIPKHRYNKPIR